MADRGDQAEVCYLTNSETWGVSAEPENPLALTQLAAFAPLRRSLSLHEQQNFTQAEIPGVLPV